MPSITIRNLTKQYNGEDGQAVTIECETDTSFELIIQ